MQAQVLIYQIGRLDTNVFQEQRFCIDEKEYKTSLSSFALKQHFGDNISKVILAYPVSLFFNSRLIQDKMFLKCAPQELIDATSDALNNPHAYLKNPHDYFEKHPHSKAADHFFVIHSIGTYSTGRDRISFSVRYSDIFLEFLVHMIETHIKSEGKIVRYIIDISSGHNIYVSTLLEAARQFGVFLQLSGCNNIDAVPEITIAISDPVLPQLSDISYEIHFDPLQVRSLFASPVRNKDIFNLSKLVLGNDREMKREFQHMLESFAILFSSIKNSTPLPIFHFGYHEKNQILDFAERFLSHTRDKLFQNYLSSPGLKRDVFIKAFFVVGLYQGLVAILQEKGVSRVNDLEVDISSIKEKFDKIYNLLGLSLNQVFLGSEVSNLLKKVNYLFVGESWTGLYSLLHPEQKRTGPDKRNFFAHAGFEQNITMVKKEGKKILFKYCDKELEKIKKWLTEGI